MKAMHVGICRSCGQTWQVGDPITRNERGDFIHAECPEWGAK